MADERAIDRALARWVRERSGSVLLGRAALAVGVAEGEGHACAALDAEFTPADLAALRAHAWVGDGSTATPFVLHDTAHLYTLRNWRHETLLAAALRARVAQRAYPLDADTLARDVGELFAGEDEQATCLQRIAVAAAPGSGLFVLTGGPGTGKTATAVRLLLLLLRHATACGLPPKPALALAAPTGKAAQRLAQSLASGVHALHAKLDRQSPFDSLLDAIPHGEARTLHRLLGFRPLDNTFARAADNPIAADIVVVDEASMVDLALMRQLLTSLRPHAQLILLGDPGQLAAVEAGSVLADIVAHVAENALPQPLVDRLAGITQLTAAPPDSGAMTGHVITLTHGWRAGHGLQRGLQALRGGDMAALESLLAREAEDDLHLYTCADAADLRSRMDAWLDTHCTTYAELTAAHASPAAALARLRGVQILCALREGAFGARGINALLEQRLGARVGIDTARAWYHGRPVLITRNDYARDLFNGDLGIALHRADGMQVWFEDRAHGGVRSFAPRALPEHETAWAITIHRSQGSEYGAVAVVLPPDPLHRILSRELLYTAVSRATASAEIWTTADALRAAVGRPIRRIGGLRERLR